MSSRCTTPRRRRPALASTRTGRWEWDLSTGDVHWSDGLRRLTECEPGGSGFEAAGRYLALVPAEDRAAAARLFAPQAEGEPPVVVHHRLVGRDGRYRWVQAHVASADPAEEPPAGRLVGTVRVLGGRADGHGLRPQRASA